MTAGCDHGPNSQARCDFVFRELAPCSMLKPLTREIVISWIRCHTSPLIGQPRRISTFRDINTLRPWTIDISGYQHIGTSDHRHFGTSAIAFQDSGLRALLHAKTLKHKIVISLIWLPRAPLVGRLRSFHDFTFRESS
jgi:hypothetical protein